MKYPLISIGMPVMNGAQYLATAIESILDQSYSNFELIIADDVSTDNSTQIIEKYARKDKRIHFIKHKIQQGRAENFNYVLEHAKGEYFIWHSQDDLRDPKCLEILYQTIQNDPHAVVAVSRFANLHHKKTYPHAVRPTHLQTGDLQTFLQHPDLSFFYGLYKTAVLRKTGGYYADNRPFFKSSDFVMICRPLLHGNYVYTPELLFYKRDSGLHTDRYATVKNNLTNQQTRKTILRYLLFPYFFLIDRVVLTQDIFQTNKKFTDKILLFLWLWINYMIELFKYFLTIIRGIPALLSGITRVIMHKS
ncbi:MAG: glycosyltransferase family 2 protein [Weeksellaceae bacterium]